MKITYIAVSLGVLLALMFMMLPACGEKGALQVEEQISAVQGGSIASNDGNIAIAIPPGALTEDTTVSISVLSEDEWTDDIKNLDPVGPVYNLEADEATFQEPVTVKLAVDSSLYVIENDKIQVTVPMLYSINSTSQPESLQDMRMVVDPEEVYILGNTTHFSPLIERRGSVKITLTPRGGVPGGGPGEVEFKDCDVNFDAKLTIENLSEKALKESGRESQKPANLTELSVAPTGYPPVIVPEEDTQWPGDLDSGNSLEYTFQYFIPKGTGKYGAYIYYEAAPVDKPKFKNPVKIHIKAKVTSGCGEDKPQISTPPPSPTPLIISTSPTHGDTDVRITSYPLQFGTQGRTTKLRMNIRFSKSMDQEATEGAVTIYPPVSLSFRWMDNDRLLEVTSAAQYDTEYTVVLGSEVKAKIGDHLEEPYLLTFRTEDIPDVTQPNVKSVFPSDGQENVSIGTSVTVTFSEPMDTNSIQLLLGPRVPGKYEWNDDATVLTFRPRSYLWPDTKYVIDLDDWDPNYWDPGVPKDTAGNQLLGYKSSFKTENGVRVIVRAKDNSSRRGTGKDTGIDLNEGDRLIITVDPNLRWRSGDDGPYSRESNADGSDIIPGQWTQGNLTANYGALVGKIGEGVYFLIGTRFDGVVSDSGRLYLYFWDENAGDNSGWVEAVISVRKK
jgi:hypothetical protein